MFPSGRTAARMEQLPACSSTLLTYMEAKPERILKQVSDMVVGSRMELAMEASVSQSGSRHTTLLLCSGRRHIGILLFLSLINLPSIYLRFPVVLCERLRLSPVDTFKSCAVAPPTLFTSPLAPQQGRCVHQISACDSL